ncbi:MAG: double-strand break repair helicase AddA [Pseudobdellovibrionaceae bacterium]
MSAPHLLTHPASQALNPDPNIPQQRASSPTHDVWVAASAGSGKTKVLTDRVLRLLLPDPEGRWVGAQPHRILCITFTKAAAALMALRVQKRLAAWAVMGEADLYEDLEKLLGIPPPDSLLHAARQLFSSVLDAPGGLSIMTIHSFCQSVIGRFPLESGVAPGSHILPDLQAERLLREVIHQSVAACEGGDLPTIAPSFRRISLGVSDLERLQITLLEIAQHELDIHAFLERYPDCDAVREGLLDLMDFRGPRDPSDLSLSFCARLPDAELHHMGQVFAKDKSKTGSRYGQQLIEWLMLPAPERALQLDRFTEIFRTQTGTPRQYKKLLEDHPPIASLFAQVYAQIENFQNACAQVAQAQQTADLLTLARYCLTHYAARKQQLGALDFNDLIIKTRQLLAGWGLDWVHFKLDEGIDHILVDEAQDTNSHQWDIIRMLSAEFLSGWGQEGNRHRTLFVVGDAKQSIFSFHGADPDSFARMQAYFQERARESDRDFPVIPLQTSFRSTRPVLDLVDQVFAAPELARSIGVNDGEALLHYCSDKRKDDFGSCEIHDVVITNSAGRGKQQKTCLWQLPVPSLSETPLGGPCDEKDKDISLISLPVKLAATIAGWLTNGEILEATGRPIAPRDILILVRTRTGMVGDIIRQLKRRNIPVGGIDRMRLTEHIAVADMIALAHFARFPADDLSLACVLKSPFIRLDEDELMTLALDRPSSLWDAAQTQLPPAISEWLTRLIERARHSKPFDFFDDALSRPCPYDLSGSGWRAFATLLGAESLDPLDEFLTYALSSEAEHIYSLEDFLVQVQGSTIEIKRDQDEGEKDSQNKVRIMTVHGSKGLEAPIVFLPDTTQVPNRGKLSALQWLKSPAQGQELRFPLWSAGTAYRCMPYKEALDEDYARAMAEYNRLLYVALTRPRDRIIIMGSHASGNLPENCWYNLIKQGFDHFPARVKIQKEGSLFAGFGAITRAPSSVEERSAPEEDALPHWRMKAFDGGSLSPTNLRVIMPSRIAQNTNETAPAQREMVSSPLVQTGESLLRGTLTHRLFEILPELPPAAWRSAGERFLNRIGELPSSLRHTILEEVLRVLGDPDFSPVFGPDSLAEVPISGLIKEGVMISGQIDRLVIREKDILIVDYKTNRPSPLSARDIPLAYLNQLGAYKSALSKIYPRHRIVCALLWTDRAHLMPIPADLLDPT